MIGKSLFIFFSLLRSNFLSTICKEKMTDIRVRVGFLESDKKHSKLYCDFLDISLNTNYVEIYTAQNKPF